ncbi:preprotein translocase subunit SecE [Streptacidiphilus fuscans]|uniref:Protein translocase subunit SecE n=1 Tax=Streptacidiphilus fuscans TaxID=2789292 RepID=A0A931B2U9_9ACTN|nr:preprotein translocase subunit SecE [Streptacidiphilus fuscans]MBF9067951.1 preprotein translocase subunit SecE [Streptacidiphilus fuscans]
MTETVGSTATPESGSGGSGDEDLSRRDRKRARKAGDPEGRGGRGREKRPNVFARTARLYRQIIAELRKVVWPTRNELTSYTSVVIVFVLVIMALVYGLDTGFVKLASMVFG